MTPPAPRSWVLVRSDRDFAAHEDALKALRAAGFSVGAMQQDAPAGLFFGRAHIEKWRNLGAADREALHGVLDGSPRFGPVRVSLHAACPEAGAEALARAFAQVPSAAPEAPAPLTIGEMVDRFDLTPRTLRFWEYKDLIAPIRDGQRRLYPAAVVARIDRIVHLKAMGFALDEILALLELEAAGDDGVPLATRMQMMRNRAAQLEQEWERNAQARLRVALERLDLQKAGAADEPPAVEATGEAA